MTSSPLPLSGIRVVSMEQYIAGPYCTSILASLGAEVLKIENPRKGGDPRRAYTPQRGGLSSGFASYNRGKRSVAVDLDAPADVARLKALISEADVLVSNLRPGVLHKRGIGADRLRAEHPALIISEISGFGTTGGPYGDWPAFDSVIQAMSGLSSLLTPRDGDRPALAPMSTTDIQAGTWAALGILAALVRRAVTPDGVHIDAAMYDITVASLERPLALLEFGMESNSAGSDSQSPVGTFRAIGGWVAIVVPTDEMWRRCCTAIDREDLHNDPRLGTIEDRAALMDSIIIPALENWAIENRLDERECAAQLRAYGQPAGPVQTIEEVRTCPQLASRAFFEPLVGGPSGENGAPIALARFPLLFDGEPLRSGQVPQLGEYNPSEADQSMEA
ncbi:CaiB/BaiF CoA-transferase family protein [Diaminobutyricimonas sp. LJ205]|uniref:CaiB/BaiF CoA transferase family protein n=1 Tax=Diaminobutyricimonas sp. LJ205 TaxID=2683590 RepID=UPI0012F49D59|nr:CoA transferase [Diaminobutyricimonas sp. LJ205]